MGDMGMGSKSIFNILLGSCAYVFLSLTAIEGRADFWNNPISNSTNLTGEKLFYLTMQSGLVTSSDWKAAFPNQVWAAGHRAAIESMVLGESTPALRAAVGYLRTHDPKLLNSSDDEVIDLLLAFDDEAEK
jgi:hypothetical protein